MIIFRQHMLKMVFFTLCITKTKKSYFTSAMAVFPGFVMVIEPPHMHMHLQLSVRAGTPFTFIFALPGAHADVMAGVHGCGVNVPMAADVAVAT